MSCLGVLFAIDPTVTIELRKIEKQDELVKYVQENGEKNWDENWLCETDKAWDAIHRCFANGELELFGGIEPLNSIIFGGEILNTEADYYVSLKTNALAKRISAEIVEITEEDLRKLYANISDSYQGEKNEEDFQYTWEWFQDIKEFYGKIGNSNKDVIFTVDQ